MTAPKTKAATKAPKRKRSQLTVAGDEGARAGKRIAILTACQCCDWNLARVAEHLSLASSADVIRALKELAPIEYAEAQADGLVSRGNRA
jgi:hypothetical protein